MAIFTLYFVSIFIDSKPARRHLCRRAGFNKYIFFVLLLSCLLRCFPLNLPESRCICFIAIRSYLNLSVSYQFYRISPRERKEAAKHKIVFCGLFTIFIKFRPSTDTIASKPESLQCKESYSSTLMQRRFPCLRCTSRQSSTRWMPPA